jgi:hypothetical protein
MKPHPLASKLMLLKNECHAAGLHVTAQKLEIAVKAIGWEIVARGEDPPIGPCPPWLTGKKAQEKHEARHKRSIATMRRAAWKEIDKLPGLNK